MDKPQKGESWIGFFRRTGRFADLMLMAWGILEFDLDQMVTRQFGLPYYDKKAKILTELGFNKKLEFLKKIDYLSSDELKIITKFQGYRNKLFHGNGIGWTVLSESEKEKLMDMAIKAVNLTRDILLERKAVDKIKTKDLLTSNF